MGEVRRSILRIFCTPSWTWTTSISMLQSVVTTTGHVINYGISINTNTMWAASFDQTSKLGTSTTTTMKVVWNRLIVEPPWIKFPILWPFISNYRLLCWENFNTHPSHLTESFAFCLDISMGPTKHFDDTSFLTIFIDCILNDGWILPNEIWRFRWVCELRARAISCFNNKWKSIWKWTGGWEGVACRETLVVPVILQFNNWTMLAASSFNLCWLSITTVDNVVIADYTTHSLETFLIVSRAR